MLLGYLILYANIKQMVSRERFPLKEKGQICMYVTVIVYLPKLEFID